MADCNAEMKGVLYTYPFVKKNTPQSSGIYKITCTGNGKFYVGSTVHFYGRWLKHIREMIRGIHDNAKMLRAWQKYGSDVFTFEVVEFCEKDDLISREQYYLDTYEPTLNIATSAEKAWLGRKHSEETLAKMSVAQKGRTFSDETLKKMSESRKGCVTPPEILQKMNEAKRKNRLDRIAREGGTSKYPLLNDSEWLREQYHGKMMSLQAISDIVGVAGKRGAMQVYAAMKFHGIPSRSDAEASSMTNKGRVLSAEIRTKMSAGRKASWERKHGGLFKYALLNDAAWLFDQYHNKKLSLQLIANVIGIDGVRGSEQVHKAMKVHGIVLRNNRESQLVRYAQKKLS